MAFSPDCLIQFNRGNRDESGRPTGGTTKSATMLAQCKTVPVPAHDIMGTILAPSKYLFDTMRTATTDTIKPGDEILSEGKKYIITSVDRINNQPRFTRIVTKAEGLA